VFRHGSSGARFSEARTRAGARFETRSMSTTLVEEQRKLFGSESCLAAKAVSNTRSRKWSFFGGIAW